MSFVFTDVQVIGKLAVEFRACDQNTLTCLDDNYIANTTKLDSMQGVIGSKTTYTVPIPSNLFKNINIVEQNVIIVAILTNTV